MTDTEQDAPGFGALTAKITRDRGFGCASYKEKCLRRRIAVRMRARGVHTFEDYAAVLDGDPHEYDRLIDALTINVTKLFRNWETYDAIERLVVPVLLRRPDPALRVWSAGCSDGAELYTVVILLAESGALLTGRVELLGTDCRPDAVARAAAGSFDAQALKAVPPPLLDRYFEPDGPRHCVRPAIRAATTWRRANALAGCEPGAWDLVLCRNLAIYLQPDAAAALWASLAAALRPGGVMVLGKAERPSGVAGLAPEGPCAWRRAGGD